MNRNEIIDSVLAQYPAAAKLSSEAIASTIVASSTEAFREYMIHGEVMAYSSMHPLTGFELLDPADVDVR